MMTKTLCIALIATAILLMVLAPGHGENRAAAPARPAETWEYAVLTRSLVLEKARNAKADQVLSFDHRGGTISGISSATTEDQQQFQSTIIHAPEEFVRKMFPNRRKEDGKMRWEIDVICALGAEGWELVQVEYLQPEPNALIRHYFKRRVQQ